MKGFVKSIVQMMSAVMIMGVCLAQDEFPVTMNFDRTDIRTVLNILGQMRPSVSLVVDEGIEGEVTVNIKDVPWEKAMKLVLEPRGYVLKNEGDNIYRVTKKSAVVEIDESAHSVSESGQGAGGEPQMVAPASGLVVDMMTQEDMAALPMGKARELIGYKEGDAPMTDEQVRRAMKDSQFKFVKELKSDSKPASEVIRALAEKAGVSYSISQKLPKSVYTETIVSDVEGDEEEPQVFEEGVVDLTLRETSLPVALDVVAEQGGYEVRYTKGIWKFVPAPPDQQEPLALEGFEVKYVKVNSNLVGSLSGGLTKRGSIKILGKKSILVKDTEGAIDQVRRILAIIDKPIPQVQVEVRFFEVSKTNEHELGVDWKTMLDSGIAGHLPQEWVLEGGGTSYISKYAHADDANITNSILTIDGVDPTFKALNQMDYVTQLANPKIVVASGEQAIVHIGDQLPMVQEEAKAVDGAIETTISLDSTFGGESSQVINLLEDKEMTSPPRSTYSGYLDVGTILTVAPSVKSDDEVYVKIVPELLTADFEGGYKSDTPAGVTAGTGIQYPKLSKTTVYTEFMLKSGQTAAIGGLVKDDVNEGEDKVPFLGDLPFLGRWFTYKSHTKTKKEVLIFVTVKIIDTKNLDVTAGIPAKAEMAQEHVNEIRDNDSKGAEYVEREVPEEEPSKEEQVINSVKNTLGAVVDGVKGAVESAAKKLEGTENESVEVEAEDPTADETDLSYSAEMVDE